jgi:hypothetical protein
MKRSIMVGLTLGSLGCLVVALLLAWSQWNKAIYEVSVAATAQSIAEDQRLEAEAAQATAQAEVTRAISAQSTAQAEATRAISAASIAVAEAAWAEAQRLEAERQSRMAQSRALAAYAEDAMDHELAVLLGLEAVYQTHQHTPGKTTAQACSALYHAIERSRPGARMARASSPPARMEVPKYGMPKPVPSSLPSAGRTVGSGMRPGTLMPRASSPLTPMDAPSCGMQQRARSSSPLVSIVSTSST